MPYARIRDYEMYYEDQGSGPAIVLLHNGLGSSKDWARVIELLSPRYRVIANDRRGYGRSTHRYVFEEDYLIRDADDQGALLDLLKVQQAHLWGHSDGGTIAMLLAIRRPELVRSLVLESTHCFAHPEDLANSKEYFVPERLDPGFQGYLADRHGEPYWRDLVRMWVACWSAPEAQKWDMRPMLGQIRCPTLVVHGAHDPFAHIDQAVGLVKGIPDCELWVPPHCGHSPHTEHPEAFARHLMEFLARQEEPSIT